MRSSASGSGNVVSAAMKDTRAAWIHVAVFSAIVNLLMLTGSLYMMQVYDRVLSSRSLATLVGISLLALAAYAVQGFLDHIRIRMLGRIGCSVDVALSPYTLRAALSAPLRGAKSQDSLGPFRDLAALRGFLASLGPTAFIDMPFAPLFLAVCFLLHPWLGFLALGGMVTIVALTVLAERLSLAPSQIATRSGADQSALIEAGRRNAEAVAALGMRSALASRFAEVHGRNVEDTMRITERTGGLGAFAKAFRFILQSAVLGLGGYLVIRGEMSGGAMIAASIVTARALAPVELAVSHLKGFVAARQAYARLKESLPEFTVARQSLQLPVPTRSLSVEDIAIVPPGRRHAIVSHASFQLQAGEAAGLIGPSGSGKSSLARTIVGIWPPARGVVRLDGAGTGQWDADALGRSVGYLPQDVELFPGTISENISRFDPEATSEMVLLAAREAGAHDMIVSFADGYATSVGEGGASLSGGQRQRVALARALYGQPFLVVLDEPNSSLDAQGDEALAAAISSVKARGGVVVVITHRPAGLAGVDKVGLMTQGRLVDFGPRDEVLARAGLARAASAPRQGDAVQPENRPQPAAVMPVAATVAAKDPQGPIAFDMSAATSTSSTETLRRVAQSMRSAAAPPDAQPTHKKG